MNRRSSGYTLVELMIVVGVLSILAMIAIPAYKGYITTARETTARANIEPLRIAVEDYRLDNMATGYAPLNGLAWDPETGDDSLKTGVLGWKPDGDQNEFIYEITAPSATSYSITVTPIGHPTEAQTFTKSP